MSYRLLAVLALSLAAAALAPAADATLNHRTFRTPPAATYYDLMRVFPEADSVIVHDLTGPTEVASPSSIVWTLTSQVITNPSTPATTNSPCAAASPTADTVVITAPAVTVTLTVIWVVAIGSLDGMAVPISSVVPLLQGDSVVESKLTATLFDYVTGASSTALDEDHFAVTSTGTAATAWGLQATACGLPHVSDLMPDLAD